MENAFLSEEDIGRLIELVFGSAISVSVLIEPSGLKPAGAVWRAGVAAQVLRRASHAELCIDCTGTVCLKVRVYAQDSSYTDYSFRRVGFNVDA